MAQDQHGHYTEKWVFILQYYHRPIEKRQKLTSWHSFMSHIRENPTFVIMGHYGCQRGIWVIKKYNYFPPAIEWFLIHSSTMSLILKYTLKSNTSCNWVFHTSPGLVPAWQNMVLRTVTSVLWRSGWERSILEYVPINYKYT